MARTALDPGNMSNKWARNLKNSVNDMVNGVNAVTDSPMEKAAAKSDKYLQGVQNSVTKWQAGLRSVDVATWKKNTTEKIQQRLPGGVDAALPKRQKFDQALANYINSNVGKIDTMPDMNANDSKNRMIAWFETMSSFAYKK
jgi:hypothetical protein